MSQAPREWHGAWGVWQERGWSLSLRGSAVSGVGKRDAADTAPWEGARLRQRCLGTGTEEEILLGKGHGRGTAPREGARPRRCSLPIPGQAPALMLGAAALSDHPPCAAASRTAGDRNIDSEARTHSSHIPLIPLPPELLGFYRSAEIPFYLLFLGIPTTSPDLPSRSINILGNSTTPNSLSFLYMFRPRNRFPFPPTQGRV